MALGKVVSPMKMKRGVIYEFGEDVRGLESVRYTRSYSLGRKRILVTTPGNDSDLLSSYHTPLKRCCSDAMNLDNNKKSALECLPKDVLVRVLCAVEHDDLRQLIQVSKTISEATLVAKQWHFAYSTPRKTRAFRDPTDLENPNNSEEKDAPNAPRRRLRQRSFVSRLDTTDISVELFS